MIEIIATEEDAREWAEFIQMIMDKEESKGE